MRFLRFQKGDRILVGVLDGKEVVSISEALAGVGLSEADSLAISEMVPLIESGNHGLDLAAKAVEVSQNSGAGRTPYQGAVLKAPLKPELILATGGNYSDHREEKDEAPLKGKEPIYFFKPPRAVVGPGEPVERDPRVTTKLDYEVELAVVIGKQGRHISKERAIGHIFGYTVLNDISARERQVRTTPEGFTWYEAGASKNFDTCCPMGPVIVTPDEIPDPQKLKMQTRVNNELRQNNTTASMTFGVMELVSFFSTFLTLYPGYAIATGTPGGTAWGNDPELGGRPYTRDDVVRGGYLNVGDEVCCEIEGIGVLCNPIVGPQS